MSDNFLLACHRLRCPVKFLLPESIGQVNGVVIASSRNFDAGGFIILHSQWEDSLNTPFAETSRSHDCGTMMILECSRYNFRGGCRGRIY